MLSFDRERLGFGTGQVDVPIGANRLVRQLDPRPHADGFCIALRGIQTELAIASPARCKAFLVASTTSTHTVDIVVRAKIPVDNITDDDVINTVTTSASLAILGSIDFDATQVDFSTVTFGRDGASPIHDGHVEDVNDDGFMDMEFHFKPQEIGISCGDTEVILMGETFGGIKFTGTDAVETIGCN